MSIKLSTIPQMPGVYIFKGQKEKILYVGKAKNLRNRLRSYFQNPAHLDNRKAAMVRLIKDFSYIVTGNELEALILEASLIKQHKPRFNIILRDDKSYPYIMITAKEQWPRVEVVRRIKNDGNIYFGPYVPAQAMWEAVAFIRRNFPIRTCRYALDRPMRPCIQYQMKRCPAPCAGLVEKEEYSRTIDEVALFLKGERLALLNSLESRMQRFAEDMRFEEAADLRDKIAMLRRAFESQKVIAPELGDMDIIGCYLDIENSAASFSVIFLRNGVMIGAKEFYLNEVLESDEAEIMRGFIESFYAKDILPPPVVLICQKTAERAALEAWLKGRKEGAVRIIVPKKGKPLELLKMAEENARLHYIYKSKPAGIYKPVGLKEKLALEKEPESIGAFDISTIQGSESVGAFVFWEKGEFKKERYRQMKIKTVEGVDDYAMVKEAVERILLKTGGEGGVSLPDLIVIDGGKGQLDAARAVMHDLGINTELISVAKKPDRAFLLNGDVVDLEDRHPASLLLKKIRDEVHRFVIAFHRKLRDKRLMESPLEKINGIGKKRRLELLRRFGSLEAIRKATVDEIVQIKGFNAKIAKKIVQGL
jgi:excinuclease ABC subunit C